MEDYPRTLLELERRFANEQQCRDYLSALRWPTGFRCPRCGADRAWQTHRGLWLCAVCRRQSSVTAGTIFAQSNLPLTLWLRAIWQVVSQKKGASALGLQLSFGAGQLPHGVEPLAQTAAGHDPPRTRSVERLGGGGRNLHWGRCTRTGRPASGRPSARRRRGRSRGPGNRTDSASAPEFSQYRTAPWVCERGGGSRHGDPHRWLVVLRRFTGARLPARSSDGGRAPGGSQPLAAAGAFGLLAAQTLAAEHASRGGRSASSGLLP